MKISLFQPQILEQNPILRAIVDAYFRYPKYFTWLQLIIFIFGYFIPFYLQIFHYDPTIPSYEPQILICNIVCFGTTLLFMVLELSQMRAMQIQYLQDKYNVNELFLFILQTIYFVLKFKNKRIMVPFEVEINTYNRYFKEDEQLMDTCIISILNCILLYLSLFKTMKLITVNSSFGTVVRLVENVIHVVPYFLTYFIYLIFIQSLVARALGQDGDNEDDRNPHEPSDYVDMSPFWKHIVMAFRNAIGDLESPESEFWQGKIRSYNSLPTTMIYLIWIVWFINIIFALIILLNFLIAYVSESHEFVLENKLMYEYTQKCSLCQDYYQLQHWWGLILSQLFKSYKHADQDFLILTVRQDEDDQKAFVDHQQLGIIKKFKQHLTDVKIDIILKIKTEISALESRLLDQKTSKKEKADKAGSEQDAEADMKTKLSEMQQQMEEIKQSSEEQAEDIKTIHDKMVEMKSSVQEQMKNMQRDVATVRSTLQRDVGQLKSMLQKIAGPPSPSAASPSNNSLSVGAMSPQNQLQRQGASQNQLQRQGTQAVRNNFNL